MHSRSKFSFSVASRLLSRPRIVLGSLLCLACWSGLGDPAAGGDGGKSERITASLFANLKPRLVGPALMSGRVGDFAVNPQDPSEYYVAVCSGGVWKTVNAGTTYTPIFDTQGSYSIGCLAMDPTNPEVVWVGTGENNSQRSVSFGDGVYRTRDGGKQWECLGLKQSEHIGMIAIHPRNPDIVYVAAQGPLWRSGGDRGLYKTVDGGQTWERILYISDDTGANEVHLDPRDPETVYVSTYQRRRRVWTLINGGPESGIHKSVDGGRTWRELKRGLPSVDKGRIGLDLSPVDPDVLYAIVEAAQEEGGFFRSRDRGETWEKRGDYMSSSPQYYNEIFCDPEDVDRVYALDTFLHATVDGGKSFQRVPIEDKHVDDHALWIDPANPRHLLIGCDGGIYESWDRGANWQFRLNLPVTQFYRVSADNSEPFYYVYGGTQDNNSQGGPSRTTDRAGITSEDWFITVGGDGYETVVDPDDPNRVYSQWQYGGLIRFDRRTGEVVDIKPREAAGEPAVKWNWDSPLILSPHDSKRLYFAGSVLFRSNDRGDSWQAISGDLTRGIDRNTLEVMGAIQSVDAVSKHKSTSYYGNAVSLTESPVAEGLLYVGTDDGLVHVSGDDGESWRRIEVFPGVPERTYVSCLTASVHDADTVFAAFDNHKNGDFKPYLLKSQNRGETWVSIAGDLPDRDIVYSVQQDHEKPELLFAGTEFGAYFTLDGGKRWLKISGLPTISVRDMEIQRREDDLVLGTFGRGIYILDDYSPLRIVDAELTERDAYIFPVKDAWWYVERNRLGGRSGRGSQGASYFTASNPLYGAVFTYYLKEKPLTAKERRRGAEKKVVEAGQAPIIPPIDALRQEENENDPGVLLIVRDRQGSITRRIPASREEGLHRAAWNLRHPSARPVSLARGEELAPWERAPSGPLAEPGTYTVTLAKEVNGEVAELCDPVEFEVVPLAVADPSRKDQKPDFEFLRRVAELQRAVEGALRVANEADTRIAHLRRAIAETPKAERSWFAEVRSLELRLKELMVELRGDPTLARHMVPEPPSVRGRVSDIVGSQWHVTSPPTRTQRESYEQAATTFGPALEKLRKLVESELTALEARLEEAESPWTPGRVPVWKR